MTILVTGARGTIGGRVVAELANAGLRVRASARDTAGLRLPAGAEAVELDIETGRNAEEALHGVEAVFLYPTFGAQDAS